MFFWTGLYWGVITDSLQIWFEKEETLAVGVAQRKSACLACMKLRVQSSTLEDTIKEEKSKADIYNK